MHCFKFLHALHESLNAFYRHCVVARSAETTYVAVTLHANHTLAGSELQELVLEVLILWLQKSLLRSISA